jgi:enoyl-CoA hydratase
MPFETVIVERAGAVATVTINRPTVLNALNARTIAELGEVFDAMKADAAIRAVIVTGAGPQAFVAGADIKELAALNPAQAREVALVGQDLFDRIEHLGKPVIAAINGYALGGGCELALACTLRVAAATARLGQPEIKLGIIPGYGGTQRLTRLVGRTRALELLLTGAPILAPEAERIGLVNHVVPADRLLAEAGTLAQKLADQAPVAVGYILEAVGRGLDVPLGEACALEASLFGLAMATEDSKEGMRAFLEKRKAKFEGR